MEQELKARIDQQNENEAGWRKEFARRLLLLELLKDEAAPVIPPISVPAIVDEPSPEKAAAAHWPPRVHLEPPSLWILGNNLPAVEQWIAALGEFGFLVQHFRALAQVDQAMECELPCLMLIDLDSLESTSVDALQAWRRRGPEQLQLLFLSRHQDFDTLMTLASMGAAGFLAKPFEMSRLMDTVDGLLPPSEQKPFRVLLVDEDPLQTRYYQGAMESAGLLVNVLDTPQGVLDAMVDFHPDVVLLDLERPGCRGDQVARMLRLHNGWPEVPVVCLSREHDPDAPSETLESIAEDFLCKPVTARQLVRAITLRARRGRLLSGIRSTDTLTGLSKHSTIKDRLDTECLRTLRNGASLSIALVNIDHFKSVNEHWGHAVGDRVIKSLAHLLRNRLRKSDIAGRYGGDEFLVLLPDSVGADVVRVLEEVADRFQHIRFGQNEEPFSCTLSVGVADTRQFPHAVDLLRAANGALHAAKQAGSNAVKLADEHRPGESASGC